MGAKVTRVDGRRYISNSRADREKQTVQQGYQRRCEKIRCANFKDLAVYTFPVKTKHILAHYPNDSNSAQS